MKAAKLVLLSLFFGLTAAACATPSPSVSPEFPAASVTARLTVKTKDGLALPAWRIAAVGPWRGNLVIVHGLKDYSEHYLNFAHEAAKNGFQVFGFDLRGHGRSPGEWAYVEHFSYYVEDVQTALKVFAPYLGGKPVYLFGHSMGGGIVARYAEVHPKDMAGFVLSGPALKPTPEVGGFLIAVTKGISVVWPSLGVVDLPDDKFSRDPAVVASMATDPLIHDEKLPARTAAELLGNMDRVNANTKAIRSPSLIVHGAADVITNPEGSKAFHAAVAAIPGSDIKLYPNAYHDLLHDSAKAQVQGDIIAWLRRQTTTVSH